MRRILLSLAAVLALVALPTQASSQIQAGPYLAFHNDFDLGIGGFVGIPTPSLDENMSFVGDFGIFFPGDNRDYWEANGNLLYSFPLEDMSFTPWVIAGLNLAHRGYSPGNSDHDSSSKTDIGVNLGGGVTFGSGPVVPFAGIKIELAGGDNAVLFGGLTFTVGSGS
jgi:hypothetical protein